MLAPAVQSHSSIFLGQHRSAEHRLTARDRAVLHKPALLSPWEVTNTPGLRSSKSCNLIREGGTALPATGYLQGSYVPKVSASFLAAPTGPVHWGHFFFSPVPPLFTCLGVSFLATSSAEPQCWSRASGCKHTELSWVKKPPTQTQWDI